MIRLLKLGPEEIKKGFFFVFTFDEDDFVIARNKEEMKKYLLEVRIDPEDIEEDFDPGSDEDVFYFNPHWDYEDNVNYSRLCAMLGGAEIVEEEIKDGYEEPLLDD